MKVEESGSRNAEQCFSSHTWLISSQEINSKTYSTKYSNIEILISKIYNEHFLYTGCVSINIEKRNRSRYAFERRNSTVKDNCISVCK